MEGKLASERPVKTDKLIAPCHFSLGCFLFTIELTSQVSLPPYKGDVIHRVLGKCLKDTSPRLGVEFFHPKPPASWPHASQTPPKPYVLVPPLSDRTQFESGDTLDIGFTLFGHFRPHITTLFAALEKLGFDSGLDDGKGFFVIRRLAQATPRQSLDLFADNRWQRADQATTAAEIFALTPPVTDCITLNMTTPLRLKEHGILVRRQLSLPVLVDRLVGRANTLATMYSGGPMLPPAEKIALVSLARSAEIVKDSTHWRDWSRDGARNNSIKFGGLMGEISYSNVPPVLLPWLNLGKWIRVGGKTSFGLGNFSLEIKTCTS